MYDRVSAGRLIGLFGIGVWMVVNGCASVSPPDGGARDLVAPKLLRTEPANGATRVKGREVRLFFSEAVTTKQLSQQLIVTPEPGRTPPVVKEEGTSFTVQFADAFAPNTTYSLDFGETITDITENNKAERITLAFTTGDALDSGVVRGSVKRLTAGQPEPGAAVGLYPESDTTNPSRQRPFYRTISRPDGSFELKNVRPGNYRIFALADANNNLLYEEPERIGYQQDAINVDSKTAAVELLTARLDTKKPYIVGREEGPGRVVIRYNEGLSRVAIRLSDEDLSYRIAGSGGKELELFSMRSEVENRLIISAFDSANNIRSDTLKVKFDGLDKSRGRAISPVVRVDAEASGQASILLNFPVAVRLKAGIMVVGRIEKQMADKLAETAMVLDAMKNVSIDSSRTQVRIGAGSVKAPAGSKLTLRLDSTAFALSSGQAIRFPPIPLVVAEAGPTGTVSGSIYTTKAHYFVQLLNEAGQVVQQVRDAKTFQFGAVAPGKYRLRMLIDEDGNGHWDGPDPKLRRPAEAVTFHPDVLEVRANWEQEVKLSF